MYPYPLPPTQLQWAPSFICLRNSCEGRFFTSAQRDLTKGPAVVLTHTSGHQNHPSTLGYNQQALRGQSVLTSPFRFFPLGVDGMCGMRRCLCPMECMWDARKFDNFKGYDHKNVTWRLDNLNSVLWGSKVVIPSSKSNMSQCRCRVDFTFSCENARQDLDKST